MRQRIQKKKI